VPKSAPAAVNASETLRSKLLCVLGFCAIVAAAANVFLAFGDAWAVKTKVDQLEQELSQAKERNEQTRSQIRALQSDPKAIEQIQRIRHHTQPGEQVLTR